MVNAKKTPYENQWLWIKPFALPFIIFVIWSVITENGDIVPSYQLPKPKEVINAAWVFIFGGDGNVFYSGTFLMHLSASFKRVIGGFFLGSSIAVPLGIVLGYKRNFAVYIEPTLQLSRSIPGICWLPLALIWFGIGNPSAIFLISLGSFYAVLISTIQGVKYVDPILLRAALCLGASERSLLFSVILPAAFPSILSGLRIGLTYSWIYLVLGEFTGVNLGLGATLLQSRETLNTELIMALMIIIGSLGLITDWIMLYIMQKIFTMDVR